MEKRPYHERYYLLYGNEAPPDTLDINGTLSFLTEAGYGDNFLKQAREKQNLSQEKEKELGEAEGQHRCSFCGRIMFGAEYETLKDGRKRCTQCSRTAIRKEEEFQALLADVREKFEKLFGVNLKADIAIKMVNEETFNRIPENEIESLFLRDIQKCRNGYYIIVRNGSPRLHTIFNVVVALTGVWQDLNYDRTEIAKNYGQDKLNQVLLGMEKWAAVRYFFEIGETGYGRRQEMLLTDATDDYGKGFRMYKEVYPISQGEGSMGATPFDDLRLPLAKLTNRS